MKITFNKEIQGELYQRFLPQTPAREDFMSPTPPLDAGLSIGFYDLDIDGLTDTLMSSLVEEMKEHGIEPIQVPPQGLWLEEERCYLEMKVANDYRKMEKKQFGKIQFPEFRLKREYVEKFPYVAASGSVIYEHLHGNAIKPMLSILKNQGYEVSLQLLPDRLDNLASRLEKSKGELTLNIYTGDSG